MSRDNRPAGFLAIHRTLMEAETTKQTIAAFDQSVSRARMVGVDTAQIYAAMLDHIYETLAALRGEAAVIDGLEIFLKQQRDQARGVLSPRPLLH